MVNTPRPNELLVSGKPVGAFTPANYHAYVRSMFKKFVRNSGKPTSPAPGLSVSRTKKGKLSVRYASKQRAFKYVLTHEIGLMAEHYEVDPSELKQVFQARDFIITQTKLDAEKIYSEQKDLTNDK